MFKRVTTGIIDSAILPFCVACQNIVLKKYQTDLTVTLIENRVKVKASLEKLALKNTQISQRSSYYS